MNKTLKFFEEIMGIPRVSGKEEQIADYLIEYAKNNNLQSSRDKYNNVFIRKDNNSSKTIILQAHSDMVCVSNNNYDFDSNGIDFYIDDDYYKAKNTSLGADDGIGIAIILAILEEKENMPNIEVMITTQEETTMLGAINFDYNLLTANTLISLDGIKEGDIESSSAGMCSITLTKKITRQKIINDCYKLSINGLRGGHSGDDIDKNRNNAIKTLAKSIANIGYESITDLKIGEKDNVIPTNGYVTLFANKSLSKIEKHINHQKDLLCVNEPECNISIEKVNDQSLIYESDEIVSFINKLEDGLLEVYPEDKFPLLSSNVGVIRVEDDKLTIKMSIRSSDEQKLNLQIEKLKILTEKYNFNMDIDANKPFFPFKQNSQIRTLLYKTYKELFDRKNVPSIAIPFDIKSYLRYLDGLVTCDVSLKGYDKEFMQSLKRLANMVYENTGTKKKEKYMPPSIKSNNSFSPSVNSTLDKMRKNY